MPKGPGTYGSKVGRPKKKKLKRGVPKKKAMGKGLKGGLTAKQRKLPPSLQKKIIAAKKKKAKK